MIERVLDVLVGGLQFDEDQRYPVDEADQVRAALVHLAGDPELRSDEIIVVFRMAPINQPDFFNGAFLLSTDLEYVDLVKTLKGIEDQLGRKRIGDKDGPREIDLDVVAWNGKVVDRDFYQRDFLRRAVLEIAPDIIDET